MKRSFASIILMALTVVSVASMMMRPARADTVTFVAQLLTSNEVPPVSNADKNAFGSVTITVDTNTNTYSFSWIVNNVAASNIILSHIHENVAGLNGPVRVDSGITPGSPIPVVGGSASFSKSGIVPATDAAGITTRLLANPAGFYFNIHSNLNPGGVVRGQLVRQQVVPPAAGAAPTLSEWGAILMGLLIIAAGVFFLVGRKTSVALAAATAPTALEAQKAIDWKLLAKVTLYVEAAIALSLIALSASVTDAVGALTSGLLVAFIVHVLVGVARRR